MQDFFTGWIPFLSPNQECQSNEEQTFMIAESTLYNNMVTNTCKNT